jgi:hypothetical protein
MTDSFRYYHCAACRQPVFICRRCDRGQIYCADGCSEQARKASMRAAGRRYQQSRKGRFNLANRVRHYRQRKKNVTHQGSQGTVSHDLLEPNETITKTPVDKQERNDCSCEVRCSFCGKKGGLWLRTTFLAHHRVQSLMNKTKRWTEP